MKKQLLIAAIAGMCAAGVLAGCEKTDNGGKTPLKNTSGVKEITTAADATESAKESSETDETDTAQSESQTEQAETAEEITAESEKNDPSSLPGESGSMIEVGHALALFSAEAGMAYDYNNSEFFWGALSYLMSGYGMQSPAAGADAEGNLALSTDYVKEFAAALFSEYDGNNSQLPELQGSFSVVSYDAENDMYSSKAPGFGTTKVKSDGCQKNDDGTYTITLVLLTDADEEVGRWEMTIKNSTFNGTGHPLFNYTVVSFVKE